MSPRYVLLLHWTWSSVSPFRLISCRLRNEVGSFGSDVTALPFFGVFFIDVLWSVYVVTFLILWLLFECFFQRIQPLPCLMLRFRSFGWFRFHRCGRLVSWVMTSSGCLSSSNSNPSVPNCSVFQNRLNWMYKCRVHCSYLVLIFFDPKRSGWSMPSISSINAGGVSKSRFARCGHFPCGCVSSTIRMIVLLRTVWVIQPTEIKEVSVRFERVSVSSSWLQRFNCSYLILIISRLWHRTNYILQHLVVFRVSTSTDPCK